MINSRLPEKQSPADFTGQIQQMTTLVKMSVRPGILAVGKD